MKDGESFRPINRKNNIKNFFPRLYWHILNSIVYNTVYFLDTNILISLNNHQDARKRKLFCFLKKIVVSENIDCEVIKKVNENSNFKKNIEYKVASINTIKEKYPEACPVYYNAIAGMNNPAIINSPSFQFENYLFPMIKGKKVNHLNSEKYWMRMMDAVKRGLGKEINILNEVRSEREQLIDEAFFHAIKKKKKKLNGGGEININDLKNLANAFCYSIFYKKNVVFVSADRDVVYLFLTLIDHFIQQMVFMRLILEKISTEGDFKNRIWGGEKINIFLEKDIFDKEEDGFRGDVLSHDWKKHSFRFSIKFWDIEKQKYITPIWVNFDNKTLDIFKKNHGGVTCPFVKNIDYGNWLHMRYYWPPRSKYSLENNLIEFEIKRKENIYRQSQQVPWPIHNLSCYFSRMDQDEKINNISSFSV